MPKAFVLFTEDSFQFKAPGKGSATGTYEEEAGVSTGTLTVTAGRHELELVGQHSDPADTGSLTLSLNDQELLSIIGTYDDDTNAGSLTIAVADEVVVSLQGRHPDFDF